MIKDAVLIAAGRGTRMLPASLFSPKETLPLVDTPILNHLIWEAERAGATRLHLVLSDRKAQQMESFLRKRESGLNEFRPDLPDEALSLGTAEIEIIPMIQSSPNGVMDAISTALEGIEGAFLVLLGDMLLMDAHLGPRFSGPEFASSASEKLVLAYENNGLPCVGVNRVEPDEATNYGVVEVIEGKVVSIIEKPALGETTSNLILSGRYIFPAGTQDLIERFSLEEYGELQSIEILRYLSARGGLNAVDLSGMKIYDSGDPLSWLKSQIDHALNREDMSGEIRDFIRRVL
jgi:UTP--glucose-1-phosphate uridylyltransferase